MSRGTSKSSRCETSMGLSFWHTKILKASLLCQPSLTGLFPRPSLALKGGGHVAQPLGHPGHSVRGPLHHGVPVSERRSHRPAAVAQIRRQPRRHRTPDRTLFHAGRRALVTRRSDRSKARRQSHSRVRACIDDARQPRHGVYRWVELANSGTARRRRRRRRAQCPSHQDDDGLVCGPANRNRDGDLRQFVAGGRRHLAVDAARDRCRSRRERGISGSRRADRDRHRADHVLSPATGHDGAGQSCWPARHARAGGGDRRRPHLGTVQCRICHDPVVWAFTVCRTRLDHHRCGVAADRLKRPQTILVTGTILFAGLMLLLAHASIAIPTLIAIGLVSGLSAGPMMSLPAHVLQPATRAIGMGIFYTIYYAAMMLGPVIGGASAKWSGSAAAALDCGALALLACPLLLLLFNRIAQAVPPV